MNLKEQIVTPDQEEVVIDRTSMLLNAVHNNQVLVAVGEDEGIHKFYLCYAEQDDDETTLVPLCEIPSTEYPFKDVRFTYDDNKH